MTYSFPCQDLSVAGKGKGMAKGGGTRSGLLWEVERLLDECTDLPQILLMENVTQVHGQKNIRHFRDWLVKLERLGYRNYFQDLNSKGFEVPQNRDRTFMVSILGEYMYKFPTPKPLTLRLKDVLEEKVDEKYYLSENMLNFFKANSVKQEQSGNGFRFAPTDGSGIAKTITTHNGSRMDYNFIEEPEVRQIGNLFPSKTRDNPNRGRLYDTEGISPCLDAMQGGQRQPFIFEEPLALDEQNGYIREDGTVGCLTTDGSSPKHNNRIIEMTYELGMQSTGFVEEKYNEFVEENGYVPELFNPYNKAEISDVCPTITTQCGGSTSSSTVLKKVGNRIRKLTPRECYRLMGFSDEDFDKASAVNSNNQLYKQAGNSICVPVLEAIFKQFF